MEKLSDIDNFRKIILDSYSKPGEGTLLSDLWYIIELYNPTYSIKQKNASLILIMRELLKKNLIKVNKGERKPYWEKGQEEYIESLKDFLLNVPSKELEKKDPELIFIRFDYEFVDWQIDSADDLKKFDFE